MVRRKVRGKDKIQTFFHINGVKYTLDDFPYAATIPAEYFTKNDSLKELKDWLGENTEGLSVIVFHKQTVHFQNESDATYMKLVLG